MAKKEKLPKGVIYDNKPGRKKNTELASLLLRGNELTEALKLLRKLKNGFLRHSTMIRNRFRLLTQRLRLMSSLKNGLRRRKNNSVKILFATIGIDISSTFSRF